MLDKNELAMLIVLARGAYLNKERLTDAEIDALCTQFNASGVLSISAIASLLGVSFYRVDKALEGQPRPDKRGQLNPAHLPWLGYMLSLGKVNDLWLISMLSDGTSLSTVSDLTLISEATLYRRRKDVAQRARDR